MRAFDSLRGRAEFTLVMRRGTRAVREPLTIYGFAPRGAQRCKLGVVIPVAVGTAVRRNRLRRRCKAIFERAEMRPPHRWFVVTCRPGAAELRFAELRRHLTSALAKTHAAPASAPRRPA